VALPVDRVGFVAEVAGRLTDTDGVFTRHDLTQTVAGLLAEGADAATVDRHVSLRWVRAATIRDSERFELSAARRGRLQLAVRGAVDAPADRHLLAVQERLPVALADWRVVYLL
jgi:hypothetical protein